MRGQVSDIKPTISSISQNMIRFASSYGRNDPQNLMNPGEIVVHVENRNSRRVVLNLLAESVRKAGKPPLDR
ncbi:MAG: hypothetical protein HY648_00880 [Acidobacteria bacterium]|nr:hypothetical protein [Acidobacteriota bacterium]